MDFRRKARLSSTKRGYGIRHQELRQRFARLVRSGNAKCARCGLPIAPNEPWDLGHDDVDRSRYVGPEHQRCNRATAGRKKGARMIRSRVW